MLVDGLNACCKPVDHIILFIFACLNLYISILKIPPWINKFYCIVLYCIVLMYNGSSLGFLYGLCFALFRSKV